jgi:hypothetical protein
MLSISLTNMETILKRALGTDFSCHSMLTLKLSKTFTKAETLLLITQSNLDHSQPITTTTQIIPTECGVLSSRDKYLNFI